MSLFLLKRVSVQVGEHGIVACLLAPDLPAALLYGPQSIAIQLANLWRLRRERPYLVASSEGPSRQGPTGEDDLAYVQSLPQLCVEGRPGARCARYVGQGDVSPLMPRDEEDFLLLLPHPPPEMLPSWPHIVTELNAVLVGQVDEFIKIQTIDHSVVSLVDALPDA
jgi:hypothetical protein